MTAVEKFAICRALFESQTLSGMPLVDHQFRMSVNEVADAVCPTLEENRAFRNLCERDNWVAADNPFKDDDD